MCEIMRTRPSGAWIVPDWNVKLCAGSGRRKRKRGLNCTRLECKGGRRKKCYWDAIRLNCTRLECKGPCGADWGRREGSLNCTRLECKGSIKNMWMANWSGLNCTRLECKDDADLQDLAVGTGLNCTRLECKGGKWKVYSDIKRELELYQIGM